MRGEKAEAASRHHSVHWSVKSGFMSACDLHEPMHSWSCMIPNTIVDEMVGHFINTCCVVSSPSGP